MLLEWHEQYINIAVSRVTNMQIYERYNPSIINLLFPFWLILSYNTIDLHHN